MNGVVLGFSGQIGSGKSTVARALARYLDCPCVSFGNYVRKVAQHERYDESRDGLQELGQHLLETRGAEDFCIDVLQSEAPDFRPGKPLVIDGVRHSAVANALPFLVFPSKFALIFMRVDQNTRENRLALRDGKKDTSHADKHPTEQDVQGLLYARADLTLVSTRPSGELVRAVITWIAEEQKLWNG